ncbi:MAG TPA: hypothetical protein VMU10_01925 [Desulfomonilia bacterium]|nr:hypothetical protein [Desulfomonilia bacterium]
MRSWYLVMIGFIGVIIALILLIGYFNDTTDNKSGSLLTFGRTSCPQQTSDMAGSLPWQLDAVSIGAPCDSEGKEIQVNAYTPALSSLGRPIILQHHVMGDYLKAQGCNSST